jgi:hypothetical protein
MRVTLCDVGPRDGLQNESYERLRETKLGRVNCTLAAVGGIAHTSTASRLRQSTLAT